MDGKSWSFDKDGNFFPGSGREVHHIDVTCSFITILEDKNLLDDKVEVTTEQMIRIAKEFGIPIILPNDFSDRRLFVV